MICAEVAVLIDQDGGLVEKRIQRGLHLVKESKLAGKKGPAQCRHSKVAEP